MGPTSLARAPKSNAILRASDTGEARKSDPHQDATHGSKRTHDRARDLPFTVRPCQPSPKCAPRSSRSSAPSAPAWPTSGRGERLSRAALAIVLLLDVFVLFSIFDGLEAHTRQLATPWDRVPAVCREVVLEGR
jgi:hypothetical protein